MRFGSGGGGGGSGGAGASLLDPNYDETFVYYTRSDFAVDKKKFFGTTTGADQVLALKKITFSAAAQNFVSSNLLGTVFVDDNPIVNTAQVRLLYNVGKVDIAPVVSLSLDAGSTWKVSDSQFVSGLFVVADFTFAAGLTSSDMRLKVVSSEASELAGFGVDMVQDAVGVLGGDTDFETHTVTAGEATSGLIALAKIRFTPGAHQLLCNFKAHVFMAPDFMELGDRKVQFAANFFQEGDQLKFYVGYGLLNNAGTSVSGGGLVSVPIDKDYAIPLVSGKHYLLDAVNAGADITLNLDAGTTEADIKVTVINIPSGRKVIIDANGTEKIFYNDTDNLTVEFVYAETEAWAEFVWNGTKWLVNDNSNVLSGTFSGALTITGALTPSGGIVGKTDGVAVAAGYVGERRAFTSRTVTGSSNAWAANATPLDTIPSGVWLISCSFSVRTDNAGSFIATGVSTNTTADNSGRVVLAHLGYLNLTTSSGPTILAMAPDTLVVGATPVPLYAKSYSEDAAVDVTVSGVAIRIA